MKQELTDSKKKQNRGFAVVFAVLILAVLAGAVLSTALGSVSIEPGRIMEILAGGGSVQERNILTQIRLPRMCMIPLRGRTCWESPQARSFLSAQ